MLPKLLLGIALLWGMTATAMAQTPSGSIALETAEGSGTGDTMWSGCTLLFKGKAYGCTVSGLTVPVTGIARVSGAVYDLKDVGSFAGTYKAAGDTFALGAGHVTVKNQNGVSLILSAFGGLAELQVADKGIEVTLKEEGKKAR
jgi:hypothetical protein